MNQDFLEPEILSSVDGGVGVLTLNRPHALNALSLEMIRSLAVQLKKWAKDDSVDCVVFVGAGQKAFCSGGDVKSFYHSGMDYRRGQVDRRVPSLFFAEEYALNKQIFHYPKPTIAFMNGITMGGGYGVAGHCKYRIATEKTVFAMPEVGIGFFPDIGAIYHLNKAPQQFGRYLALTGRHIGPGDMLAAGLADFYTPFDQFDALLTVVKDSEEIASALEGFCDASPGSDVFDQHANDVERVFEHKTVSDIFEQLRKIGGDFAQSNFDLFAKASPLSVAVTLRHLDAMFGQDFDTVIEQDFMLAQRFIEYPDMYEGIRAALIEKDRTPVWEPPTFNDVKDEDVERYFKPLPYGLSDIQVTAT